MVEWPATLAVLRAVARLGPGAGADRPGSPEAGGRRERSQRRGALTRARGPHPHAAAGGRLARIIAHPDRGAGAAGAGRKWRRRRPRPWRVSGSRGKENSPRRGYG